AAVARQADRLDRGLLRVFDRHRPGSGVCLVGRCDVGGRLHRGDELAATTLDGETLVAHGGDDREHGEAEQRGCDEQDDLVLEAETEHWSFSSWTEGKRRRTARLARPAPSILFGRKKPDLSP